MTFFNRGIGVKNEAISCSISVLDCLECSFAGAVPGACASALTPRKCCNALRPRTGVPKGVEFCNLREAPNCIGLEVLVAKFMVGGVDGEAASANKAPDKRRGSKRGSDRLAGLCDMPCDMSLERMSLRLLGEILEGEAKEFATVVMEVGILAVNGSVVVVFICFPVSVSVTSSDERRERREPDLRMAFLADRKSVV